MTHLSRSEVDTDLLFQNQKEMNYWRNVLKRNVAVVEHDE